MLAITKTFGLGPNGGFINIHGRVLFIWVQHYIVMTISSKLGFLFFFPVGKIPKHGIQQGSLFETSVKLSFL